MKGLLYKEWYLGRKSLLLFGIITFMLALLGVLVCFSMNGGNLKELTDRDPQLRQFYARLFFFVPYIVLLLSTEICLNSIFRDYATGWMHYSYTLPLNPIKTVGAKYIGCGILITIGFVFGVLYAVLIGVLSGVPYTLEIMKYQIGILIVIGAVDMIMIPVAYHVRAQKTVTTIAVILGVACYAACGALLLWGEKKYGMDAEGNDLFLAHLSGQIGKIEKGMMPFVPVILILLFGICFCTAARTLQRREKF